MVFLESSASMASPAPLKFMPRFWNWSKTANRKVSDSSRKSSQSPPQPPPGKSYSDSDYRSNFGSEDLKNCSSSEGFVNKSENRSTGESRSKILVRFRTKREAKFVEDEGKGEVSEEAPKTWNLRPRKAANKRLYPSGEAPARTGAAPEMRHESPPPLPEEVVHYRPESLRPRNNSDLRVADKKEKARRLEIPLSKGEIEEDIFLMTGSKPSRRPRKRSKMAQKNLDCVFPGMWLDMISSDSYRVSETSAKG